MASHERSLDGVGCARTMALTAVGISLTAVAAFHWLDGHASLLALLVLLVGLALGIVAALVHVLALKEARARVLRGEDPR